MATIEISRREPRSTPGRRPRHRAGSRRATRSGRKGGTAVEAGYAQTSLRKLLAALGATGKPGQVVTLPKSGTVAAPVIVAVGLGERPRTARDAAPRRRSRRPRSSRARARSSWPCHTGRADGLEAVARGRCSARTPSPPSAAVGDRRTRPRRPPSSSRLAAPATGRSAAPRARRRSSPRPSTSRAGPGEYPTVRTSSQGFADRGGCGAPVRRLEVDVLDERALQRGGYGGILGVGQGSANPPRLVRIAYRHPTGHPPSRLGRQGHHLRLRRPLPQARQGYGGDEVRHGRGRRRRRRHDRHRPARPAVNVTGWLPLAENMPSGTAQRPGTS